MAGGFTYVAPVTLSALTITAPATKTVYTVGDPLDLTGLIVTGTYSDGSTQVESITPADIAGFDSSVAIASQALRITFGEENPSVTYIVSVVARAPSVLTSLVVSPASVQVIAGGSQVFTAAGTDQYSEPIAFTPTWTSSNTAVATIDQSSGSTAGIGAGTATITATAGSVTGTATLTVTVPFVPTPTPAPTAASGGSSGGGGSSTFTAGLLPSIAQQQQAQQRGQVLGASTTGTHPDGTLVSIGQTVYIVQNGQLHGFRNQAEFATYGYSFSQVVPANSQDEALPINPSVVKAKPGSLVLDASDNRTVYIIGSDEAKHGFTSEQILLQLGYSDVGLPVIDLGDYTPGEAIGAANAAGYAKSAVVL